MAENPDWPDGEDDFSLRKLEEGDPHFAAIGQVAYSTAVLEALLDSFICALVRADDEPLQCLIAQLNGPGPRRRAIIALAKYRKASIKLIDKINRFTLDAGSMGEKRNRAVHDAMFVSTTTGRTFKMIGTADQVLNFGWQETTDKKLIDLAVEIDELMERGRVIYFQMTFEIGTTEQKEFLQQHGILPQDHPLG